MYFSKHAQRVACKSHATIMEGPLGLRFFTIVDHYVFKFAHNDMLQPLIPLVYTPSCEALRQSCMLSICSCALFWCLWYACIFESNTTDFNVCPNLYGHSFLCPHTVALMKVQEFAFHTSGDAPAPLQSCVHVIPLLFRNDLPAQEYTFTRIVG